MEMEGQDDSFLTGNVLGMDFPFSSFRNGLNTLTTTNGSNKHKAYLMWRKPYLKILDVVDIPVVYEKIEYTMGRKTLSFERKRKLKDGKVIYYLKGDK
jgi:hypothetical protein